MENLMITINAAEFGLDADKAKGIEKAFTPTIESMNELGEQFNNIIDSALTPELSLEAKTLRQKFVKIRTAAAGIHKTEKSYYRNGGLYVDAWKNAHAAASQGIEERLKDIEEHFINIEREEKKKLQAQRASILSKYMDIEVIPQNLGEMDAEVWEMFSGGAEQKYKKRIREEKKAEKERLAEIEADRVEQERIRGENEKLKNEKAEADKIRIDAIETRMLSAVKFLKSSGFTEQSTNYYNEEFGYGIPFSYFGSLETDKELDYFINEVINKIEKIKDINLQEEQRKIDKEAEEQGKKLLEALALENKNKAAAPDKDKILAYLVSIDNIQIPEMSTEFGKRFMHRIDKSLSELHEAVIEDLENA